MAGEYTVRNASDEILASFDTEAEALEYGSRLADAMDDGDPDAPLSVVAVIGIPDTRESA